MSILITLVISVVTAQNGISQTRLGLHVTQEELNIWRQRRTDNVNAIGGITYQSMWNTVVSNASGFTGTSVGAWNPRGSNNWNGSTCFPDNFGGTSNSNSPSFDQGWQMLAAAFVAMVDNNSTYGSRVRTFLINHATDPLLDLSNSTAWCVTNYDGVMIRVAPWFTKALFAYDYLRTGGFITGSDRIIIENWLNKAGTWFLAKINLQISQNAFPKRPNDYSSCTGTQCGGNQGTLYFNGPTVNNLHTAWNNRISAAATFVGAAGVMVNPVITWNANFTTQIKWFVTEALRFQTWPSGANYDISRWHDETVPDKSVGSAWTHGGYALGPLITVADHQARAGDAELYNYTTTVGLQGTPGPPAKTLLNSALWFANATLGVNKFYATTNPANQTDTYWIRPFVEGGSHSEDVIISMGNNYWQNATVRAGYSVPRVTGTTCGGYRCVGTPWGVFPHVLFMFGGMEGKVSPYSSAPTPPAPLPLAPTNLQVIAGTP